MEHFDPEDTDAKEFVIDYVKQLRDSSLNYTGMNRIVTDSLMYHADNGIEVCNSALNYHTQIAQNRN